MISDMNKTELLKELYERIYRCDKCFNLIRGSVRPDEKRVERRVFPKMLSSDIFVVLQSLGEKTQRVSGIAFHDINGNLSRSGKFFEQYLNKIGYSLCPESRTFKHVYTSDLLQCYPGKKLRGSGDNTPINEEMLKCRPWMQEEMSLVDFKAVLLFGRPAAVSFFAHFLNTHITRIEDHFEQEFTFQIDGQKYPVFVLPHPTSMVKDKSGVYERTFRMIGERISMKN